MRHPASAYRQFAVQGATPLGLVVMLYDGTIAALQRAVKSIESRDIQNKCNHLNRAMAIIAQLDGTLDLTRGGEVARTLKALYAYARNQIIKGNIENSPSPLQAVIQNLSSVREAWAQADRAAPPTSTNSGTERPEPTLPPEGESGLWSVSG